MFNAIVDTKPIRDGEEPAVSYTIERFRDGVWVVEKVSDVTAGQNGSSRKILLEDDQRLVVQAMRTSKTVYDPKQSAVVAEGSESKAPDTAEGKYNLMLEEQAAKEKERQAAKDKEAAALKSSETQGNERQVLRDQQQPTQHITTQVAAPPAPSRPTPSSQPSTSTTGMRSSKDLK